jgi:hypothetical protein
MMARAPKPAAAGTKPADTGGAPPAPAETSASAAPAADAEPNAGAESAESTAGSVSAAVSAGRGDEAGKGDGTAAGTAPEPAPEVRTFEAARTILHDGVEYQAGAPVPLTRSAFEALPQGAVAGDWTD